MSIAIKINSGDDRPFAVDIEEFPTRIALDKPENGFMLVPLGLFIVAALFFVTGAAVALPVGALLTVLIAFLLWRFGRQNIMQFEKNGVMVTEAGALKDVYWEAVYTDFSGVHMRTRKAKSGRTQTTYQIIELKHPDPEKTLPLYVEKTKNVPKTRWQRYARLFDIPPVRE